MTLHDRRVILALAFVATAGISFYAGRESLKAEIRSRLGEAFSGVERSAPSLTEDTISTADRSPIRGWRISVDTSLMDGSESITLSLDANTAIHAWPDRDLIPTLIIRCKERKTDLYIVNGVAPEEDTYGSMERVRIRLRLDSDPPAPLWWAQSTDQNALFAPNPVALAKGIVNGTLLAYEFTPYRSGSQQTTFTLTGLGEQLPRIAAACEWRK